MVTSPDSAYKKSQIQSSLEGWRNFSGNEQIPRKMKKNIQEMKTISQEMGKNSQEIKKNSQEMKKNIQEMKIISRETEKNSREMKKNSREIEKNSWETVLISQAPGAVCSGFFPSYYVKTSNSLLLTY
jgi:methyl-accepting chemotaxis protein